MRRAAPVRVRRRVGQRLMGSGGEGGGGGGREVCSYEAKASEQGSWCWGLELCALRRIWSRDLMVSRLCEP